MHFSKQTLIHIAFIALLVLLLSLIFYRIRHFGVSVDLHDLASQEGSYNDSYDNIMPLTDADGYLVTGQTDTILVFGNDPFAEDADSSEGLAALVSAELGASVINLSVSGSYMAAERYAYDETAAPLDAFCPYWMGTQLVKRNIGGYFDRATQALGDDLPPEAERVIYTLNTLDLSEVDVIVFAYDLTDYRRYHSITNPTKQDDVQSFTGNLVATYELIHQAYPSIRFIVMAPYYNYFRDEEGNLLDADLISTGYGSPAKYALELYTAAADTLGISYMDNYFTNINAENASDYLRDDSHLNQSGRELLAKELCRIIRYYE